MWLRYYAILTGNMRKYIDEYLVTIIDGVGRVNKYNDFGWCGELYI